MYVRNFQVNEVHQITRQLQPVKYSLGQNLLPWHKNQLSCQDIADYYIQHKDIYELIEEKGSTIIYPYNQEEEIEVDLFEVHKNANFARTRYGAFKAKLTPAENSPKFYISDMTGEPEGFDCFPWSRGKPTPELTVKAAYDHFRIAGTDWPALEWCHRCHQFFTLADSYLFAGGRGEPQAPDCTGFRHFLKNNWLGCTFFVCPYCGACAPEHMKQMMIANPKYSIKLALPKQIWDVKSERVVDWSFKYIDRGIIIETDIETQEDIKMKQATSDFISFDQEVRNSDIPSWKQYIMLRR